MKSTRKFLLFLVLTLVLTGCSLFQKKVPEKDAVAATSTEFDAVMAQVHSAFVSDIIDAIPQTNIPTKSESNLKITGKILPTATNTVNFTIESDGKSDYTDPKNLVGEATIKLFGDSSDTSGGAAAPMKAKGSAELLLKMLKQKIFFSLAKAEAYQNDQALPVALIIGPYLNKWYSADLAELGAVTGSEAESNLMDSLQGNPNEIFKNYKIRLQPTLEKVHIWKLKNTLPEENGMLRYEVDFDREAFKAGLVALAEFMATNPDGSIRQAELDAMKANIDQSFTEEDLSFTGILAIEKANVRNFSFTGKSVNTEDQAELSFSNTSTKFELQVTSAVAGSMTAGSTDAVAAKTPQTVHLTVEKTGNQEYEISVTLPEEKLSILLHKFTYSDRAASFSAEVLADNETKFTADFNYEAQETSEVKVEEPQGAEPFQNLLGGLMGGAMGAPQTIPPAEIAPGSGE